jgi:hypothetical protein
MTHDVVSEPDALCFAIDADIVASVVIKLCAVWLVVLAISPFTAPFQTCGAVQFDDTRVGEAAAAITVNVAQPDGQDDGAAAIVFPRRGDQVSRLQGACALPNLSSIASDVCSAAGCRRVHIQLTNTNRERSSASVLRI